MGGTPSAVAVLMSQIAGAALVPRSAPAWSSTRASAPVAASGRRHSMEHPRPDDKNWTWVLERPCPACRFDAGTIARHRIGTTLRTTVAAWRTVLSRDALVRQRPPGPAARGL